VLPAPGTRKNFDKGGACSLANLLERIVSDEMTEKNHQDNSCCRAKGYIAN